MCAWSVRNYAPQCKLYVQIVKPENRLHLGVADHVVVEGELKHAILANNSHCPGISTLVNKGRGLLLLSRLSNHTCCLKSTVVKKFWL